MFAQIFCFSNKIIIITGHKEHVPNGVKLYENIMHAHNFSTQHYDKNIDFSVEWSLTLTCAIYNSCDLPSYISF